MAIRNAKETDQAYTFEFTAGDLVVSTIAMNKAFQWEQTTVASDTGVSIIATFFEEQPSIAVPEPMSIILMCLGLVGLGVIRSKRL